MTELRFLSFIMWINIMSKLTSTTAEEAINIRHQSQLHKIQRQMLDDDLDSNHEDLGKELSAGDPFGPEHSLDFGATCVKENPQACKYFPELTCVWVEENTFVCRCDFQHNWNVTSRQCVANVFAPCSGSAETNNDTDCGVNMECRQDIIGSNPNEKMCRCKKGYKVDIDLEGLPSRCIVDNKYFPDEDTFITKIIGSRGGTVTAQRFHTIISILSLHSAIFRGLI